LRIKLGSLVSFIEQYSIYVVMVIVLVIWFGVFLFLLNTDKKLKEIEKEIKKYKL